MVKKVKRTFKPVKRTPCEHLNVATQEFSGVSMAVCRDCGCKVDPEVFEDRREAMKVSMPEPTPADRPTDHLDRVLDLTVGKMVDLPGLQKPFFPLFDVKEGDTVVILRPKKTPKTPKAEPETPKTS